jgi:cytochrome c556
MRMPIAVPVLVILGGFATTAYTKTEALPGGPIRDRQRLMEGIGKNAKVIGDALKAANTAPAVGAAEKIQADAGKIPALFPAGSTSPKSRAKVEIWQQWPKFESDAKQLQMNAAVLATAARDGGDVAAAAHNLFDTCKSCHDQFRAPEKKKP